MITAKAQKNKKTPQIPNVATLRSIASGSRRIAQKITTFGKRKKIIFALATCYSLLATLVYAQPISSSDLINNAKQYDGKTVVYAGEVIGDIMPRGEFAWVNVNDNENAIGIWIDADLTKDLLYTGSYKSKGDWIEVTGVFHRACLEHGGDLDIHAQKLTKISQGRFISEEVPINKKKLSIYLSGAILCLLILQSYRLMRQKKPRI